VSVMVRGLMEQSVCSQTDGMNCSATAKQYTRELLFSSIVELMSPVVCAIHPSAVCGVPPAKT